VHPSITATDLNQYIRQGSGDGGTAYAARRRAAVIEIVGIIVVFICLRPLSLCIQPAAVGTQSTV
jgi:hypothetical protein